MIKLLLSLLTLMLPLTNTAQRKSAPGLFGGVAHQITNQDTIYVSHQAKSYLLFDEPVTLADVGNPTLYQVQIEGNSILAVATEDSVGGTPFYAVVGGEPFTARLKFHSHPEAFYDFRKRSHRPGSAHLNRAPKGKVLSRLQELASYQDLNYATTRDNGIRFRLVGLMHDLSTTYLKFNVENRTSLVYQTGFVGFEQLKRYSKGWFAQEQQVHFPLEPVVAWQVKKILPYSQHYLYYALPLQTLERKEAIIATLRESNGSRSVSLNIPVRLLRRADLY